MMGPRLKELSHEEMVMADLRDYVYPIYFFNEQFVQISLYIPEVADYYFISNYGRVFSQMTGRINRSVIKRDGYEQIILHTKDGRMISYLVHRLVMRCFHPIPNYDEMAVNHMDGNKLHNHDTNLEWVTDSENMIHCYANNLEVNGEDHQWATITEAQAHQICQLIEQGLYDREIAEIVISDQEKHLVVTGIRVGRSWKNVSKNYNLMRTPRYGSIRRFDDETLLKMHELASSGMSTKDTARACGIDIDSMHPDDRENVYKIIRAVRDKSAYKYLFD